MSGAVPSLGTNLVVIRTSFGGSLSGMIAIRDNTLQPCINLDGTATNLTGDVGFGEAFPSAATPPIPNSDFSTNEIIGVVPIVFAVNNNLAGMGVNNITLEQANLLLFDSGPGAMPASFLGATGPNATNNVYLIGRDTDSGTRISVEKDIKYIGAETEWATNGAGGYVSNPGFPSGGTVAANIGGGALSIGYVGMSDFNSISNNATALKYEGVGVGVNNFANVTTGMYPLWAYEHFYSRIGTTAQQQLVREALIASLTNPSFQATNANWFNFFVGLNKMQVSRSTDGGQITGNNF